MQIVAVSSWLVVLTHVACGCLSVCVSLCVISNQSTSKLYVICLKPPLNLTPCYINHTQDTLGTKFCASVCVCVCVCVFVCVCVCVCVMFLHPSTVEASSICNYVGKILENTKQQSQAVGKI